jgi:hypothetical protein
MIEKLQDLRVPFAEHQISYLPKGGVKLAYVGHAALTDRLLDVDPSWTWEPLALGSDGLPQHDAHGGLWIKLTICGVTRLGYGDAGDKKGCNAEKERIGDALRNAAMRFGAALDLWHKGDLHGPEEVPEPHPKEVKKQGGLSGIGDDLDENTKEVLRDMADATTELVSQGKAAEALDMLRNAELETDQRLFVDRHLDSKTRTALRNISQQKKAA